MLPSYSYVATFILWFALCMHSTLFGKCDVHQNLTIKSEYRYKYNFLLPLYDAVLCIPEGAEPEKLLSGDYPFSLNFRYLRSIQKEIITTSAERALKENLSQEEFNDIKTHIDSLHAQYTSVKQSDHSSFLYCPKEGLLFSVNNAETLTITDRTFASQYFKIWFGDYPLSTALKKNLLKL